VNSLAFSPDGRTLVSGGWDKTVRLWDVAAGTELRRLEGHGGYVTHVAFSPDGKTVASSADDKTARLWDAATGRELARFDGHEKTVSAVAFSPDGKRLATGDYSPIVRVWDVATQKELRRLEGRQMRTQSIAFAPDGRTLAVGGYSRGRDPEQFEAAFQLWDTSTGKVVRQFRREPRREKIRESIIIGGAKPVVVAEYPGPRNVSAVAFTPNGRNLISAEQDGSVVVWEVLTGQLRRELLGHQAGVNGVAVSADGKVAASAGTDLTALIWDVTGTLQRKRPTGRLSAERLAELWNTLHGSDSEKAALAAITLTANPEQTVDFLSKKLPAVPPVDPDRLARLVADLQSDTFATRELAENELSRLGRAAEAALRKASRGASETEQRLRITRLLEALDGSVHPSRDVAASRAVEVLEWIGTPQARRLLGELERGAPGAWLTEEAAAARRRLGPEPEARP
jgi:WD40 repeat protein